MEIRNPLSKTKITTVLFDFDGTLSTLRSGWESVMAPMMHEYLSACPFAPDAEALQSEIDRFIDESTGIQTIFQMKWLEKYVKALGGTPLDPWAYKAEYNRRLMKGIEIKTKKLLSGEKSPEEYLMMGAREFLLALREKGVSVYVASGTDHPDVCREAQALGLFSLFTEIAGAPVNREDCSKEAVLKRLIDENKLNGSEVCVIGDGKVEIALGKQAGALTIGLASDEKERTGIDQIKRERLIKAGADIIMGDFLEKDRLFTLMGLSEAYI